MLRIIIWMAQTENLEREVCTFEALLAAYIHVEYRGRVLIHFL